MMHINRREKDKVKKTKKRLKLALFFLGLILLVSTSGFLVRFYRQNEFILFREEKIIEPIAGKSSDKELAEELQKIDLRIVSLAVIGKNELEVSVSGGTKIIFGEGDIKKQVSSLQLMLARFKIEGRIPQKIDLRFEKPIVVF